MAAQYRANLTHLRAQGVELRVVAFGMQEGYSSGWHGTAVVVGSGGDEPLTAGGMMSAVMASGVLAGTAVSLNLMVSGGPIDGTTVRAFPSVVSGLSPYPIDEFSAACNVHLVDPVGFLAEQPIWGAYSNVSAAEAVGGVLSLAAGGDGKPTLDPILPGLPAVAVVGHYREALDRLPYVIAAGQTLGDWLADFLATLGLRAELRGFGDGRLRITLSDAKPWRAPLEMSVVTAAGVDPGDSDSYGPILIQGHSAFPGSPMRGALLDDPTKGSARPLVAYGAIGTVLTETGLDVDEASGRVYRSTLGAFAEMFMLSALSRQPRLRPGELVQLSRPFHGIADWQVSSVSHWLRSAVYDNDATLIRGDYAWHPELPLYRPPVYVSAVVDGGNDYDFHQPVPRDRLGRIKITFPFTPTPSPEESMELAAADADGDGRVTLEDFDDEQVGAFTDDTVDWAAEQEKYDAGEYNDPYLDRNDADLTEEEKQKREEMLEKRKNVLAYRAYQKASALDQADADYDGVLSSRDALVSDELRDALRDEEQRQELEQQWAEREETPVEDGGLAEQYGQLFGADEEDLPEQVVAARTDAADEADRWPARIPLSVVKPMAGALHGFIVAHRHGDTCRVAVHNPFTAEIVGFQYRDDRRINADLSRAVAGLVVEHNYAEAWSGLVFRRTEDMEGDLPVAVDEVEEDEETADSEANSGTLFNVAPPQEEEDEETTSGEAGTSPTGTSTPPQTDFDPSRPAGTPLGTGGSQLPPPSAPPPPPAPPPSSGGNPPGGSPPPMSPPPSSGGNPPGGSPPPMSPPPSSGGNPPGGSPPPMSPPPSSGGNPPAD